MNRYALFLLTDKLGDDCKAKVEEFVKKVLWTDVTATHRLSVVCKVFASFISTTEDQNGNVDSRMVAAWKRIPIDSRDNEQSLTNFLSEGCTCSNIPDLVQALHSLCDALRRPGPLVELFWLRSDAYETCDDDIELYGCVKRLQLWHNAIVSIIIPNGFDSSSIHGAVPHHFDSLRPTILSLDQALRTYQRPVWNGSIAITGSAQSVQLPGLRLDICADGEFLDIASLPDDVVKHKERSETVEQSDVVLSSCMKFVASVDISDIPIFYISGISYTLSLTSRSSVLQQTDNFLRLLKDADNTGYILRLEYGFCSEELTSEERVAGRELKTRRSWNDFLKEHYNNSYDDLSLSCEFERVLGSHSFLVCAVSPEDLSVSNSSYPSTQESNEVIFLAYRLRNPSEISGSPMHQLTLRTLEKDATADDEDDILDLIDRLSSHGRSTFHHLDDLPHFSTKTFGKLMHNLRQAELLAVRSMAVNDGTTTTGQELSRVLLEVRTAFLENILSKHPRKECHSSSNAKYELESSLVPEYRMDPYQQPERQILMLKAADSTLAAQSKSSLQSGTLATLSPPTNNQVAVTLDAAEMLKYFNPDGTAVASDSLVRVPVKKRRQRSFHYDRGEARSLPWPECAQARFHDVYYNTSVSDEDLERKCQQLRGRLGSQETSSTFGPAQTFLLPAKAGNDWQKLPSFPGRKRAALDRRSSSMKVETKTQKSAKVEPGLSSRRMSMETKSSSSSREIDSCLDSNSCDSNSQTLLKGESRSQRNRRRLEEVIIEMLATSCSIGSNDPLFKPCFKRLYTITETFVRDLPTSRDLRENMMKIARSHVRQTVKFEKDRQKKLLANGRNPQIN